MITTRDRRVAVDPRDPRGERDGGARREHPDGAAEDERDAEQRGRDEAGEERVGERLGAVRELVEDDPAAERAAGDPDQHELEEGALHEAERPGMEERVGHASPPWTWWCAGRIPTAAPSPGSATIAPP